MKQAINPTISVFAFFVAVQFGASATTCVATKTFKVKEVCGKVTNPLNAPIAGAEVDLLHDGPDVSSGVFTDDGGNFIMPNVPRGRYEIRIKSLGYVTAAQQLIVMKNRGNNQCHKPVQVHLQPGSLGCSAVTK
jgi:Carboxypeptidase regulatory-like domain